MAPVSALTGFMAWWLNAGRRDRRGVHVSRTFTPACGPGKAPPTPAPARPLVVEVMLPPRPPPWAPAPSATSATRASPQHQQGISTQPRLWPRRARWPRSQPGRPWPCLRPTSASSQSTDTPYPQDMQLFPLTLLPLLRRLRSSSITCRLPKAAPPAAPAAPPARVTSAECPPPRVPTTTPTRRCSPTASCRAAAAGRGTDRRGWGSWTTRKHQRCSLQILMYWCITTQSSPLTCRGTGGASRGRADDNGDPFFFFFFFSGDVVPETSLYARICGQQKPSCSYTSISTSVWLFSRHIV